MWVRQCLCMFASLRISEELIVSFYVCVHWDMCVSLNVNIEEEFVGSLFFFARKKKKKKSLSKTSYFANHIIDTDLKALVIYTHEYFISPTPLSTSSSFIPLSVSLPLSTFPNISVSD